MLWILPDGGSPGGGACVYGAVVVNFICKIHQMCECNPLMAKAFVSSEELRWLSKGLPSGDTSTHARQAWPVFLALAR